MRGLAGHQDALGAVDDEVATGVGRVFTDFDQFLIGEAGDVTLIGTDHNRHAADFGFGGVDDAFLAFLALDDGHFHEDGRGIRDVSQARLLWVQQFLGAVCFANTRCDDADVAEFDVDWLLAFFVADIRIDCLLFVDDLLHPPVQEGVKGAVVVFCKPFS